MKKIITSIIILSSIFSIQTPTFASSEPIFERLLDINYWVEEFDLQLAQLDEMYFYDQNLNTMHREFQQANENIKKEIIMYYRQGRFTYYQTQWIVRAQKNFVHYVNQIFTHMKYKELDPYYADVDGHILDNYRKARSSYNKIKQIINTKY